MNLDELQRVQSKERRTDSLQNLRPSFYQEVGTYVADLKRERERAADRAEDPFSSPEVNRLTDEIETATDVVEAIYERRMGKLVKQASLAAAGMPADDEGLTAEEAALFEDLVERIRTNKGRVLDVLEGEADGPSVSADASASVDEGTGSGAAADAAESGAPEPPTETAGSPETDPSRPPESDPTGATDAADGPPTAPPDVDPSNPEGSVSAAEAMGGGPPPSETDAEPPATTDAPPADAPPPDASGDSADDGSQDAEPGSDGESAADPSPDGGRGGGRRERNPAAESAADADEEAVDRVTVRITRDVGSILGIDDREYTLRADDVVALPERNATPLVEREAAEPLE